MSKRKRESEESCLVSESTQEHEEKSLAVLQASSSFLAESVADTFPASGTEPVLASSNDSEFSFGAAIATHTTESVSSGLAPKPFSISIEPVSCNLHPKFTSTPIEPVSGSSEQTVSNTIECESKKQKVPTRVMTKELAQIRVGNGLAYLKDLENGKLEHGKWVSYLDGKLQRVTTTRADAVRGLELGYDRTKVGRDVKKFQILLSESCPLSRKRYILVGEGGSGKDSLRQLLHTFSQGQLKYDVSFTERPPRDGEVEGQDYHFVSRETFDQMVQKDQFYQYTTFAGNRYGTGRESFDSNQLFIMAPAALKKMCLEDRPESWIVYLTASSLVRKERMSKRTGAKVDSVERRLEADAKDFQDFKNFDIQLSNDTSDWKDLERLAQGLLSLWKE